MNATSVRLAAFKCVQKLEDTLLLYPGDEERIEDALDTTSRELFGITDEDLDDFYLPEDYDTLPLLEQLRIGAALDEYEDSFETGDDLTDDENMEILKRFGLDFSDDRGQPLRCTNFLARVAELAAKGIKGKMPDPAGSWADALERDREAFVRSRPRR